MSENDASPAKWDRLRSGRPAAILFWYRQSPSYLEPLSNRTVTRSDPPQSAPGMVNLVLDTKGRLTLFSAVPPASSEAQAVPSAPDWSALFSEAGLDTARFTVSAPKLTPPQYADTRAAWEGTQPEQPQITVRVEAAAHQGRPVFFQVVNPWSTPPASTAAQMSTSDRILIAVLIAVFLVVLAGSAVLAVRNLRMGRGDRKGAFRLALVIFSIQMFRWVFVAHHVPTFAEFDLFSSFGIENGLFVACFLWLMYVALEPFVRRRWPYRIISWNRLLAGGLRDPLVGRDILTGALFGIGAVLIYYLRVLVPQWLGSSPRMPLAENAAALLGIGSFIQALISQFGSAIMIPFMYLFLLLLLAIVLRRNWLAEVVGLLIAAFTLSLLIGGGDGSFRWLYGSVLTLFFITPLYRYGLLAMISTQFFFHVFVFFPITTELTAWYAAGFVLDLIIMIALAAYAFYISLAGQPLFRGNLLEE